MAEANSMIYVGGLVTSTIYGGVWQGRCPHPTTTRYASPRFGTLGSPFDFVGAGPNIPTTQRNATLHHSPRTTNTRAHPPLYVTISLAHTDRPHGTGRAPDHWQRATWLTRHHHSHLPFLRTAAFRSRGAATGGSNGSVASG